MKIIFNALNCGLGNNGGSQTIVKSANTLVNMGHDVSIIDTGANKHTWNVLHANHLKIKNIEQCPKCDVLIGTGIKTFESTLRCKTTDKKIHWIRGWETWQMSNEKMINLFKNRNDIILVTNGAGVEKILRKNKIPVQLQFAGLDIPKVRDCSDNMRKRGDTITIGGLINTRHKTKQSEYIFNIFNYLSRTLKVNVELNTFGAENVDRHILSNHFHINSPDIDMKKKIYKNVDFWISSSVNEGFHIPPAEYMLENSGVVIGVESPFNGTKHYLKNDITGYVCKNNWIEMVEKIIYKYDNLEELYMISDSAYHKIANEIGSREENMRKFVKIMES